VMLEHGLFNYNPFVCGNGEDYRLADAIHTASIARSRVYSHSR